MTLARRRLVSLILLGLLTVPAAWGRPVSAKSPAASLRPGFSLLTFLSGWLGFGPTASWLKEGCKLDPNGRCLPQAAAVGSCTITPNGNCAATPTTDAGCTIDPFGRCSTGH